ncbi:MAG: hypothetical protein QM766_12355 [Burkholderiaceae bacterium]
MVLGLSWALGGCALNPAVLTVGAGTYQASRQAFFPFGDTAALRAAVLAQADRHCEGMGGKPLVVRIDESKPPWLPDNFPRAAVQFRCENG